MDIPKVIVVAETEVHDLLRDSGVGWDVQHPVESVSQMWDDLSAGRLDQQSVAIVFSDSLFAAPGALEQAVATMAAHAAIFVLAWDLEGVDGLRARVRDTALAQGCDPDAPVHVLPAGTGRSVLDGMRGVLETAPPPRTTAFPATYLGDVDEPMRLTAPHVHEFAPAPVALVPVPQPPAVVDVPGLAVVPALMPSPQPEPTPATPTTPATPVALVTPVAPAVPAPHPQEDPLARPPLPGQVTIAVTSSKGGSGKSTIAMLVAAQIAHSSRRAFEQGLVDRPQRVVLIDMDTRDGQVGSLVGQYIPTALNIRVSPRWDEETILANLVHDERLGVDALLAPVRPRTADDVGPDFYRHVIRMLQRTHDVVVMDTSVNYLDPLISTVCLPEATAILFVTTLATTSVQGMARALQEITQATEDGGMGISRQKIGIVVNQAVTEVGMERDQVIQAALKVPLVGSIPLATKDVLTCTNYNRMHRLLEHPTLGPAYFRLATACLPGVPLVPVVDGPTAASFSDAPPPDQVPAGSPRPRVPVPVATASRTAAPVLVAQPVVVAPAPSGDSGRKRSLFGRR